MTVPGTSIEVLDGHYRFFLPLEFMFLLTAPSPAGPGQAPCGSGEGWAALPRCHDE